MTCWLELLVEEQSMEMTLRDLIPAHFPNLQFDVHDLGGKQKLIANLLARLRGYSHLVPSYQLGGMDLRVVVLVDRDEDDCEALKAQLERVAAKAGLTTRTSASGVPPFVVVNRIVCEELEAWFLGDPEAVRAAYPGVSNFEGRARYRDPDAVTGGTWESFERLLKSAGHHRGGLAKVQAARDVTAHLAPSRNRSRSFQAFWTAVTEAAA